MGEKKSRDPKASEEQPGFLACLKAGGMEKICRNDRQFFSALLERR